MFIILQCLHDLFLLVGLEGNAPSFPLYKSGALTFEL